MFARWWQHQLDTDAFKGRLTDGERVEIQTAINARHIMTNDVGTFTEDTPCKPWLIWYPLIPDESTPRSLAKRCPFMHTQIAIAAIDCNYQGLYKTLNIRPSMGPMLAAEKVTNPFYKKDLEKRASELGISDLWSTNPWIEP